MSTAAWVDEEVPCRDPECDGTAEPEGDEELSYLACTTCGFEFGFQRRRSPQGACQLGISEDTRRRFARPADGTPEPVLLQITRRPDGV